MRFLLLVLIVLLSACGSGSKLAERSDSSATTASAPTSTSTTVASGAYTLLPCIKFQSSKVIGTIKDPSLDELSGLAMSRRNSGVMWTHNDSGDTARVFAIKTDGSLIATYDLAGAITLDAEDIAVAGGQVWLADTGDNLRLRSSVALYHFDEPEVTPGTHEVENKRLIVKLKSPDGDGTDSFDVESFFIDTQGNGYLVEKTRDQKSTWVFQIASSDMNSASTAVATPVARITGNSNGSGYGPTAADLNVDGTVLVIKNYSEAFLWHFKKGSSIVGVLNAQPTSSCVVKAGLGEAITFDGPSLITVEEGVGKPLKRTSPG